MQIHPVFERFSTTSPSKVTSSPSLGQGAKLDHRPAYILRRWAGKIYDYECSLIRDGLLSFATFLTAASATAPMIQAFTLLD